MRRSVSERPRKPRTTPLREAGVAIDASTGRIVGKFETCSFPGVPSTPSTTVTYAYDLAGRLSSLTTGGQSATYAYDAAGNRAGATVPSDAPRLRARSRKGAPRWDVGH